MMSPQLRAAFMTCRNPVILVIGLLCALMTGYSFVRGTAARTMRPCHPVVKADYDRSLTAEPLLALLHTQGLEAVIKRLSNVTELRVNTAWTRGTPRPVFVNGQQVTVHPPRDGLMSVLPQCPKIRRLVADDTHLSPENLRAIGRMPQLEELSLARSFVMSRRERPPVFESLKNLHKLRKLDLTGFHLENMPLKARIRDAGPDAYPDWSLDEELHHLASLPNLSTLIVFDFQYVNAATLREIAVLPRVETLAIDLLIGAGRNAVTPDDVGQLADMANLHTLYLPYSRPHQDVRSVCKALLPVVSLRRGIYDEDRVDVARFVGMGLMILLYGIAQQVVCTTMSSLATATPRFATFHLRALAIVLGAVVLTDTLSLRLAGASAISSLSMCLGLCALMIFVFRGQAPSGDDDRLRWYHWFFALLQGLSFTLVLLTVLFIPHLLDAWLAGDFPIAAWLVIAASVFVFTKVPDLVRTATNQANEIGMGPVAGLTDFIRAQQERARRRQQLMEKEGRKPFLDMPGRLDTALAALPANQPNRNRTLLRAASELGPFALMRFTGLLVVLSLAVGVLGKLPYILKMGAWPDFNFVQNIVMPLSFMVLIAPVGIVAAWRDRMLKRFGTELLRPVSRREMQRLFFQSIALDLAPFFVLLCCATTLMACVTGNSDVALPIAALLVSAGVLVYGIGLWVIMIRRTWLAILIGVMTFLLWQVSATVLMIKRWDASQMMLIPVAIALLLGLTATALAWRHWQRREMA